MSTVCNQRHRTFSKSLSTSRQINLYEEGIRSSLFGFVRRTNLAIFYSKGKQPFSRRTMKVHVHLSASKCDVPLTTRLAMRSPRGDFGTNLLDFRARFRQTLLLSGKNEFIPIRQPEKESPHNFPSPRGEPPSMQRSLSRAVHHPRIPRSSFHKCDSDRHITLLMLLFVSRSSVHNVHV